jgi:hypothetical protein
VPVSVAARNVRRAREMVPNIPYGPRTHPCVCRAGIHEHSGAARTGGCQRTGCKRYRADAGYALAYQAIDAQRMTLGHALREADRIERRAHYTLNPRKPGEWSIGASDTSTCPKKIEYRNKPPEDFVRAPEDQREARMGTIIHAEVTRKMRALFPWREFAGKVTIPGLDRESEFDSYDPIVEELEDYKTAGDWRWDVLGDEGPSDEVWEQVMLYAYALEAIGRRVKTVRLSYIKRCNGHDETFVRDYDEQVAKAALDRLLGYATALDLGIELPRTGLGPENDALCRRCFARDHCWNTAAAAAAGRSPESYTILGAEPVDESVVWAIGEKVEQAKVRLDAEKAEKVAKTLLTGIEPGRYGDYEGYWTGGGGGDDHKARAEQLEQFYDLPDDQRPPLESLPVPQKSKWRGVRWGRVRKATLQAEARAARSEQG